MKRSTIFYIILSLLLIAFFIWQSWGWYNCSQAGGRWVKEPFHAYECEFPLPAPEHS